MFPDEDGRAGTTRANAGCREQAATEVVQARVRIRFMGWLIA
jgi:hypothetical protein